MNINDYKISSFSNPYSILKKNKSLSCLVLTRVDFSDLTDRGKEKILKFIKSFIPKASFIGNKLNLPNSAKLFSVPSCYVSSSHSNNIEQNFPIGIIYYINNNKQNINFFVPLEDDLKEYDYIWGLQEKIIKNKELMKQLSKTYLYHIESSGINIINKDKVENNANKIFDEPLLIQFTPPSEWNEGKTNLLLIGENKTKASLNMSEYIEILKSKHIKIFVDNENITV